MARIRLLTETDGNSQIQEIFDEIREKAGRVPAAYRAFAKYPHILQANWNRTKNILGEGNVSIETKEAIATRVSKVNGCNFCLLIHKGNLKKLGVSAKEIEAIETGEVEDTKLNYILNFVSVATKEPEKLTDADFKRLKDLGHSEKDILEILTVMEMYTGYNKIISALDLQPDD